VLDSRFYQFGLPATLRGLWFLNMTRATNQAGVLV
jgi:hypothetical protein